MKAIQGANEAHGRLVIMKKADCAKVVDDKRWKDRPQRTILVVLMKERRVMPCRVSNGADTRISKGDDIWSSLA